MHGSSTEFPHSANKKSKPNSYYRQNSNCQNADHKLIVPYQSYDLEDADYEQPGQFPGHYRAIEIFFFTSGQSEKLITIPRQVDHKKNKVAEENDFVVRQAAGIIYVYRDNSCVERKEEYNIA